MTPHKELGILQGSRKLPNLAYSKQVLPGIGSSDDL